MLEKIKNYIHEVVEFYGEIPIDMNGNCHYRSIKGNR